MSIFKAYDIRGVYGQDLDDEMAYRIGRAFVAHVGCGTAVVGRDMRPHSEPLFTALARGLTEQGCDVIDIGLCSTPMSYFANARLGVDGGIMITASHNPGEWNGFKLCRADAVPISGATGIREIGELAVSGRFPASRRTGTVRQESIGAAYAERVRSFSRLRGPVSIVADFANAMGIVEVEALPPEIRVARLFDELDGSFPNHEANPLNTETLGRLRSEVVDRGAAFGVAFDGDADRAGFVDEQGAVVPMDRITALLAGALLRTSPGATVLYDLRSSWAVREAIEAAGGVARRCRVGHAFIKQQMRDEDALFAGELSGHYYFRPMSYTECTALAVVTMANLVQQADTPLSRLVAPLNRYAATGEINSRVADAEAVMRRVETHYRDGRPDHLDGLTVEYDDWWFNLRASNTEPLLRLNLEAREPALMERKRDEVLALIRS